MSDKPPGCIEVRIYRCRRQDEMYLFLRADLSPDDIPDALAQRLGRLEHSMDLELTPDRKLARAEAAVVIAALNDAGWYLQMPPEGRIRGHLDDGD